MHLVKVYHLPFLFDIDESCVGIKGKFYIGFLINQITKGSDIFEYQTKIMKRKEKMKLTYVVLTKCSLYLSTAHEPKIFAINLNKQFSF